LIKILNIINDIDEMGNLTDKARETNNEIYKDFNNFFNMIKKDLKLRDKKINKIKSGEMTKEEYELYKQSLEKRYEYDLEQENPKTPLNKIKNGIKNFFK